MRGRRRRRVPSAVPPRIIGARGVCMYRSSFAGRHRQRPQQEISVVGEIRRRAQPGVLRGSNWILSLWPMMPRTAKSREKNRMALQSRARTCTDSWPRQAAAPACSARLRSIAGDESPDVFATSARKGQLAAARPIDDRDREKLAFVNIPAATGPHPARRASAKRARKSQQLCASMIRLA